MDTKGQPGDDLDHQTILNILLQNSKEMNLKTKPSAIRENKVFTLDMREISMQRLTTMGLIFQKGSAKKFYAYNDEWSRTAHKNENGPWYVNMKSSKGYNKVYVPEHEIYEVTRHYYTRKNNLGFSCTIATVKAQVENDPKPFYMIIYKWADGANYDFVLPHHGNASKPASGSYFRKDLSLFAELDDMLNRGLSTDQVYCSPSKQQNSTMSVAISSPKVVENRRCKKKKQRESKSTTVTGGKQFSEPEKMIASLHSNSLMKSVTFTKDHYTTLNALPNMLHNVYRHYI